MPLVQQKTQENWRQCKSRVLAISNWITQGIKRIERFKIKRNRKGNSSKVTISR